VKSDVPTRKYRSPKVYEPHIRIAKPFITFLRHEEPTVLLTNDPRTAKQIIARYAKRMLIENAPSDAVRFFHMNALSSAVGIKVDLDMALLVIASGLYRQLADEMRGYADAHAKRIFRDLVDMPATSIPVSSTRGSTCHGGTGFLSECAPELLRHPAWVNQSLQHAAKS